VGPKTVLDAVVKRKILSPHLLLIHVPLFGLFSSILHIYYLWKVMEQERKFHGVGVMSVSKEGLYTRTYKYINK